MSLEGAGAGQERWLLAIATIEQTRAGTKNMPMLAIPNTTPTPSRLVPTMLAASRARVGDNNPIRVSTTGIARVTRTLGP